MTKEFINNTKNKRYNFFSYRYFLIPKDVQITFDNKSILDLNRKEIMRGIIRNKLSNDIKIDQSYIKMHLYKELNEDLFICKLAKRQEISKFEDEDKDFKKVKEVSYPFIYVIISIDKQIILLQDDTLVFKDKENSICKLNEYLHSVNNDSNYVLTIDEITSVADFWDIVNNEKIYKLNLNIKSPNLFKGNSDAEKLAREVQETTNATETNIQIVNPDGDLKLEKSFLNTFLNYIASGGGKWKMNTSSGTKKSNSNNTKIGKKVGIDDIDSSENQYLEQSIEIAMSKVDIRPGDDKLYESKEDNK